MWRGQPLKEMIEVFLERLWFYLNQWISKLISPNLKIIIYNCWHLSHLTFRVRRVVPARWWWGCGPARRNRGSPPSPAVPLKQTGSLRKRHQDAKNTHQKACPFTVWRMTFRKIKVHWDVYVVFLFWMGGGERKTFKKVYNIMNMM